MHQSYDLIPLFVQINRRFRETLVADADHWLSGDGSVSPCAVMSSLTHFVAARLREIDYEGVSEIFDAVERLLATDSEEIRSAAATCFLESLLNISSDTNSANPLDPELFESLLRPLSKEYCRSWDSFNGVQTKGF